MKYWLTFKNYILQFLKGCIERNRCFYLDELELELNERFGLNVSTTTIWRALAEMGYSRKKVKIHQHILRLHITF